MMKNIFKLKAYTLAEVLLTLTIIGVVAALTVPSLKRHSDEARYVAATLKVMEDLTAATNEVELSHGDGALWNWASESGEGKEKIIVNWYKDVMNVIDKDAIYDSWHSYAMDHDSQYGGGFTPDFFTADGVAWGIGYYDTEINPRGRGCALVDINGSAPPNVLGIDIHGFVIGSSSATGEFGVYPMGDGLNDANWLWAGTAYIIRHKKMPWLTGEKPPLSKANANTEYVGK